MRMDPGLMRKQVDLGFSGSVHWMVMMLFSWNSKLNLQGQPIAGLTLWMLCLELGGAIQHHHLMGC